MILVVDYDPSSVHRFEQLRGAYATALRLSGAQVLAIEHVGKHLGARFGRQADHRLTIYTGAAFPPWQGTRSSAPCRARP